MCFFGVGFMFETILLVFLVVMWKIGWNYNFYGDVIFDGTG